MSGIGKGGMKRVRVIAPVPPPAAPFGPLEGNRRVYRRVLANNIQGISKCSLRRLARRGGCVRLNQGVYKEARGVLREYLQEVLAGSVEVARFGGRRTVTALDVVWALKRRGQVLYGFGM